MQLMFEITFFAAPRKRNDLENGLGRQVLVCCHQSNHGADAVGFVFPLRKLQRVPEFPRPVLHSDPRWIVRVSV